MWLEGLFGHPSQPSIRSTEALQRYSNSDPRGNIVTATYACSQRAIVGRLGLLSPARFCTPARTLLRMRVGLCLGSSLRAWMRSCISAAARGHSHRPLRQQAAPLQQSAPSLPPPPVPRRVAAVVQSAGRVVLTGEPLPPPPPACTAECSGCGRALRGIWLPWVCSLPPTIAPVRTASQLDASSELHPLPVRPLR